METLLLDALIPWRVLVPEAASCSERERYGRVGEVYVKTAADKSRYPRNNAPRKPASGQVFGSHATRTPARAEACRYENKFKTGSLLVGSLMKDPPRHGFGQPRIIRIADRSRFRSCHLRGNNNKRPRVENCHRIGDSSYMSVDKGD